MMTKISVDLQGHYCNHWPYVIIQLNGIELFHQPVVETITLDFDVVCNQKNLLEFEHYSKSFGENGVWDTDPSRNQDCFVQIKDIRFDDVSIDTIKHELTFISKWNERSDPEQIKNFSRIDNCNGFMNFNGVIGLEFDTPVYSWLIKEKFIKKQLLNDVIFNKSGNRKFDYEYILNQIDKIKQIIND
jgi:hypothetical protein